VSKAKSGERVVKMGWGGGWPGGGGDWMMATAKCQLNAKRL